jgi:hypothetical protein
MILAAMVAGMIPFLLIAFGVSVLWTYGKYGKRRTGRSGSPYRIWRF